MLRSMYSGISGMKNFQTKLDVIGNNISNVNTYGFKKGRVVFKDLVSQSISGAGAPTANTGGTNPKQVGLGSQLAAIDTMHTTGSLQTTGRTLDLAISGDGFYVVMDGTTPLYTRAGNFYMDRSGSIVNADGLALQGLPPAADGNSINTASTTVNDIVVPTTAQSMSIGSDGVVTYVDTAGQLKYAGQVMIAKFANPEGMEKVGQNLFQQTTNSGIAYAGGNFNRLTTANVTGGLDTPGSSGTGTIVAGTLEMSNVDLSEEFTEMIVAQRGFQANTRIITTSDEILQELMSMKR
ncbi:flagellar basal-body rod protein FlgG [Domibacillus iocasae]|uniref:Flagellar hook protein FlgE n=1 Tax=Domibacillus iocasae TaxID=1714016 RepID=A0A1E7DLQ5_9BACI|nr:flagellar basal-body rod protein FlgG [Domibacillus iocasae]OES43608.1 flagellar basal body rod protein FlgG [Domibacillus iocasae]